MATTVMPFSLGRTACEPLLSHRHLHLHSTGTSRFFFDSERSLPCLSFRERIQPIFPCPGSPSRAGLPSCRCVQSGDQSAGLEAVSAEGKVANQDLEGAQADFLARIDEEDEELLPVAAARLVKAEQERQKYLGRALRAGKGAVIADILQVFANLLDRPYGGGESVANAGGAVIERIINDVQELRGQDGVSDQMLFELLKVIRILEMDMELLRAAKQEKTLLKRLDTAQMHCKQAFAIANSF